MSCWYSNDHTSESYAKTIVFSVARLDIDYIRLIHSQNFRTILNRYGRLHIARKYFAMRKQSNEIKWTLYFVNNR